MLTDVHKLSYIVFCAFTLSLLTSVYTDPNGYLSDWNRPANDWAKLSGRITPPKCVEIPYNLSLCRGMRYKNMSLPNLLEHDTMSEVTQQAASWVPLVGIQCHQDTRLFLCSLFSPVCLDRPIWPCRSLCESVKSGCESKMNQYGFPWPEMVRCDKFPLDNDLCIAQQNITKKDITVCEACRQPATFEGVIDNFCRAEFVIKVRVRKIETRRGDKRLRLKRKKKFYKKGELRKRDLKKMRVLLRDGASCDCSRISSGSSKYMLMGFREKEKFFMSFILPWPTDKLERRGLRRAIKTMKKHNSCNTNALALTAINTAHVKRKGGKKRNRISKKKRKQGNKKKKNKQRKYQFS